MTWLEISVIMVALLILSIAVQTAQAQIPEFEERCINVDGFTKAQCDLIWHCSVVEHNPIKECEDRANSAAVQTVK